MYAAGVHEPGDTYLIANLKAARYEDAIQGDRTIHPSKTMIEYGSVGARHLKQLAHMADMTCANMFMKLPTP